MAGHKWNSKQFGIFGFLTGLFFVSLIVMRTEGASGWIMGLVGTIFVLYWALSPTGSIRRFPAQVAAMLSETIP